MIRCKTCQGGVDPRTDCMVTWLGRVCSRCYEILHMPTLEEGGVVNAPLAERGVLYQREMQDRREKFVRHCCEVVHEANLKSEKQ